MMNNLIIALNAFDTNVPSTIREMQSQLSETIEGSVFDERARKRFWSAVCASHSTEILSRFIAIYVELRHELLLRIERGKFKFGDAYSNLHVDLLALLPGACTCVQHCLDVIADMLVDGDNEIFSTASKMLAASSCDPFIPTDKLLDAFALHGVCEYPFSLGEATVKAALHNPNLTNALVAALGHTKNVNEAVLTILVELPLPDAIAHEKACYFAECPDKDTASIAIRVLGDIGIVSPRVATIVAKALESEQWFLRAIAAETAGKLKLDSTQFLPILGRLLDDTEGHDFTVQEGAIQGLGHYGAMAKDYLNELIGLRQRFLTDDYEIEYLERLDTVISTIRAA